MPENSVHGGHRARLKERFIKEGLDSFQFHEVLELLLFYAIPQRDTNELAHELIREFGSLAGVFDASIADLCKVKGIKENAACLINLVPAVAQVYFEQKFADGDIIDSSEKAGQYLLNKYLAMNYEQVSLLCLDNKSRVISFVKIARGSVNATEVNIRRMVEEVVKCNAASVIMAHNHPGGIAVPSSADIESTKKVIKAMAMINVSVRDHIIIADDDFVSFAESEKLAGLLV